VVTPVVAEPDIVARSGEDESDSQIRRVNDPLNRGVLDAVLQEDDGCLEVIPDSFADGRNSIEAEDVSVFGGDLVPLEIEAILQADLGDIMITIVN
jgi:hypothetical protein